MTLIKVFVMALYIGTYQGPLKMEKHGMLDSKLDDGMSSNRDSTCRKVTKVVQKPYTS